MRGRRKPECAHCADLQREVDQLKAQLYRLQADAVQDTLTMPRTRSLAMVE